MEKPSRGNRTALKETGELTVLSDHYLVERASPHPTVALSGLELWPFRLRTRPDVDQWWTGIASQ